ncbi:hypothetical protein WT12_29455 [Burkholderia territorii]|nr:hypothetical protein WT12_29455 [Burkholderia territorii]PRF39940.1 hypothetical protein C6Q11_24285 [Burkholderia multivorans]
MRVRTEAEVARRAVILRRFLRSVPTYRGIKVSLWWLGVYGFVMALIGSAVAANWCLAFAEWSVHGGHF